MKKAEDWERLAQCLMCADIKDCDRDERDEDAKGFCRYCRILSPEIETFKYTGENGYSGVLKHNITDGIYTVSGYRPGGKECFHSYRSNIKSPDELKEFVDTLPEFLKEFAGG